MSRSIVVIGGGVIGLSAAFRLAQEGARVRLLERRTLAAGASGATAALLEFQTDTDRDPHLFGFARLSRALFPALERDVCAATGEGFGLETDGILSLAADAGEAATLRARVERYVSMGLRADWLTTDAVAERFPAVAAGLAGGALFLEDGQVHPGRFVSGLAQAARAAGVEITENAGEVTLHRAAGRVVVRTTAKGEFTADTQVVVAGAWLGEILRPLGVDLPVTPVRGQLAHLASPVPDLPIPVCLGTGIYAAPKRTHVVIGATVERAGFDASTTDDGRAALARNAARLLAPSAIGPVLAVVAGLRPATPDALPIVGFLPEDPSVLIAGGHYRNGILLAPGTAAVVADLVSGRTPPIALAPFRPDRFLVSQAR